MYSKFVLPNWNLLEMSQKNTHMNTMVYYGIMVYCIAEMLHLMIHIEIVNLTLQFSINT